VEGRVLLIESHSNTRELLHQQFELEGLEVSEATTGADGLQAAMRFIPQVILLNVFLPDMPGVDVARRLREINRTKHVFLMMLGGEENREQRLIGLDAGANDFIDSPVDPELVALRVRNAINRRNQDNTTDPTTGLPAGRGVQDELLALLREPEGGWALARFRILKVGPFREVHGFVAGDTLVRGTARILAEALARDDIEQDFLGYGGHDDFIVITHRDRVDSLQAEVQVQFEQHIHAYYDAAECEQGYVEFEGKRHPLATLRVRSVTQDDGPFYDIRSLSEAIAG
jgi:PleD family two-component response regulator